jgi:hypothetical protein
VLRPLLTKTCALLSEATAPLQAVQIIAAIKTITQIKTRFFSALLFFIVSSFPVRSGARSADLQGGAAAVSSLHRLNGITPLIFKTSI